jgi:hypothetical protein
MALTFLLCNICSLINKMVSEDTFDIVVSEHMVDGCWDMLMATSTKL